MPRLGDEDKILAFSSATVGQRAEFKTAELCEGVEGVQLIVGDPDSAETREKLETRDCTQADP